MKEDFVSTMRNLNRLIGTHKSNGELLNGIASVIQESTNANTVFIEGNGRILAVGGNLPKDLMSDNNEFIDKKVAVQINKFKEPQININLTGVENCSSAVVPIPNGGSMLLFKDNNEEFSEQNKLSAEVGANNAAWVVQWVKKENQDNEDREIKIARAVLNSLSFTEIDVIIEVFDSIKNGEGFVVASKIADKNGYARSVTVNALRKLESAGVVQTRSLGVKGTYIKVINNKLCDEINKFKKRNRV